MSHTLFVAKMEPVRQAGQLNTSLSLISSEDGERQKHIFGLRHSRETRRRTAKPGHTAQTITDTTILTAAKSPRRNRVPRLSAPAHIDHGFPTISSQRCYRSFAFERLLLPVNTPVRIMNAKQAGYISLTLS